MARERRRKRKGRNGMRKTWRAEMWKGRRKGMRWKKWVVGRGTSEKG